MKKKLAALMALAMSMTMLASCGDDSSSSAPASQADSTPDSSVAETTTAPESSEAPDETTAPESSEAPDETTAADSEVDPVAEFTGTLNTNGEYPGDWQTPMFVIDDEGTELNFFSVDYLKDYEETGCQVTINFDYYKSIDMKDPAAGEQYLAQNKFGVGNANGWAKLYAEAPEGTSYVIFDCEEFKEGEYPDDYEGTYYVKSDGFVELIPNDDGTWPADPITFTLTAEGIKYLKDTMAENEDGTKWGGLIFQVAGVNIQSITLSPIAE